METFIFGAVSCLFLSMSFAISSDLWMLPYSLKLLTDKIFVLKKKTKDSQTKI